MVATTVIHCPAISQVVAGVTHLARGRMVEAVIFKLFNQVAKNPKTVNELNLETILIF